MIKLEKALQSWKQPMGIVSIDGEIQITRSDEQPENADSPITEMPQPGSNVTYESFSHFVKQPAEMI
jgi:hypothetical protein